MLVRAPLVEAEHRRRRRSSRCVSRQAPLFLSSHSIGSHSSSLFPSGSMIHANFTVLVRLWASDDGHTFEYGAVPFEVLLSTPDAAGCLTIPAHPRRPFTNISNHHERQTAAVGLSRMFDGPLSGTNVDHCGACFIICESAWRWTIRQPSDSRRNTIVTL